MAVYTGPLPGQAELPDEMSLLDLFPDETDDELLDFRHLSGQHNQKTHGRGHTALATVRSFDDLPKKLQDRMYATLGKPTGLSPAELDAHFQGQLRSLYEAGDKSDLAWYPRELDNHIALVDKINAQYGTNLTAEQACGMTSALSALQSYPVNFKNTGKLLETLAADKSFAVTQADIDDFNAWAAKGKGKPPPVDLQPGEYRPSDLPMSFAVSKTPGMPKLIGGNAPVVNAARIYNGESVDTVLKGPKQRSFYNNLSNPDDTSSVTIDTWQYRALAGDLPLTRKKYDTEYTYTIAEWESRDVALSDGRAAKAGVDMTQPMGAPANSAAFRRASVSTHDFFQSGPSMKAEDWPSSNGSYPYFVKQTQIVAEELGISPNGLQAVVWGTIRGGSQ